MKKTIEIPSKGGQKTRLCSVIHYPEKTSENLQNETSETQFKKPDSIFAALSLRRSFNYLKHSKTNSYLVRLCNNCYRCHAVQRTEKPLCIFLGYIPGKYSTGNIQRVVFDGLNFTSL